MNHTKGSLLVLVMLAALVLSACASQSHQDRLQRDPRTYAEAMDLIASEMRLIDRNMIGEEYRQAVPQTERVLHYVGALGRFEPPRMSNAYEEYREFGEQVEDLRRATDRLLYFIEQRRRDSARTQLIEVATRYNRLSMSYGPTRQISVMEEPATPFRLTDRYRSDLPGELRGR